MGQHGDDVNNRDAELKKRDKQLKERSAELKALARDSKKLKGEVDSATQFAATRGEKVAELEKEITSAISAKDSQIRN
eukprot:2582297-Pleurochrysis_carterae.AAC.2